ncbi:MAG: carboxypeptidase-like regulatory domain-containing protein [Williamsia sp.]|nr:carboxypeptidase-like regulatory domain-containing protein [Williamsia sp.]
MKALLFLVSCFFATALFAQTDFFTTNGKVVDATSKQALSGASVFGQNTTLGTVTNAEGAFSLKLPKGGYDLVVSYTGYETQNVHINSSNANGLTIELKAADKTLSEVVISGSTEVADGLAKYGKFFMDNFIGTTLNAELCTIKNPEVLQFFFSKKRNRLKVKAKEDLVVVNNALGYTIKYQLDSFSYDYGTDVSTYSGYPFFQELEGTPEQKELWKNARINAYNGSRLHFMRSWYDSTLEDEGFALEWVDTTKKILTTLPIKNPYDTLHYIEAENNNIEIDWPGKLRVLYKHERPARKFLTQYKLPASMAYQITIMEINDAFVIEENGYFYEQADIVNTGYWSWEKVADLLPYDYNP